MTRRYTTDEFIKKSKKIHKDRYSYEFSNYVNCSTKVEIVCNKHGIFYQVAKEHMSGHGCMKCARGSYDTKEFIKRSKIKHGELYDYQGTIYENSSKKVNIKCNECNEIFNMIPNNHLTGSGCRVCTNKKMSIVNTSNTEKFIEKSLKIHGQLYDYSLINYINSVTPVEIICKEHGIFEQKPTIHLRGSGCKQCVYNFYKKEYLQTTEMFIKKAIKVHGELYDYSSVNYINSKNKLQLICKTHGIFKQLPNNHLRGSGCPSCKLSKGEKKISKYLKENHIKYEKQKSFDNCISKNGYKLSYDFYIPDIKMLIEYDGRQHFEPIEKWGGLEQFNEQIERDLIKKNYSIENDFKILHIPYWKFDDINNILKHELRSNINN